MPSVFISFKQKTAYELRISDWSSDVCSSDLKERLGVDADVCDGDHACIRLSGCPSLTVRDSGDPLKEDPVAYIDNSCVGCGNRAEERSVGKEWFSPCSSRWAPYN